VAECEQESGGGLS